jgi:integrative and conjugative element protein (TIGR02256 family)
MIPAHKHSNSRLIVGELEDVQQKLLVYSKVIRHVAKHRQLAPWTTEAGGQLFGTISDNEICVTDATGPYMGDERSRCRYRSNPAAAQRAINEHSKQRLLYLGEWHTHAENYPNASDLDEDAMRRLMTSSQLNSNFLLLMIVGRSTSVSGLVLWAVSNETLLQWTLSTVGAYSPW